MTTSWKQAVWEAVQRLALKSPGIPINRQDILEHELAAIVAIVGSQGLTPHQTLSRVLQELRDDGVLLFDGAGSYRLSVSASALSLEQAIATETQALVKARRGQGAFRRSLERRWGSRCPLTGITEPELLRASHIVPWNQCETDAERLEPDNGILLSALWDAAFDRLLVTFDDAGFAVRCHGLTSGALAVMQITGQRRIEGLTAGHRARLKLHRSRCVPA